MGLTIHYSFKSAAASPVQARLHVERLRQAALDLPLAEVGEIIDVSGADCNYETAKVDEQAQWLLIQARRIEQIGDGYSFVYPTRVIAFSTLPGEGCEAANMGLAAYPEMIETADGPRPSGLNGWRWKSFCKTQYASDPQAGGMENFLRCHLSVIRLLDTAKAIGILDHVGDEGGFWSAREPRTLAETVGQWNTALAAFVGRFKGEFRGQIIAAPITDYPNFERLEAEGRKGEQREPQPEAADAGLCPAALACPRCGERRIDRLVWDDDERLHCATCEHEHDPEGGLPDLRPT